MLDLPRGGRLTREAIRLVRQLRELLPEDGEVAGLLALMLLTDARHPTRTRVDGELVPLAEQNRSLWDRNSIVEGVALITETLSRAPIGPYQLQAAIAAVHDEAATADATDWPQILTLYDLLQRIAPGPIVSLNRIVAVAMVRGARAGLELLAAAELSPDLAATIAWMRFAPTYSNWQVSPRQHERRIRWPRDEPSASLSGGTSSHAPRRCRERNDQLRHPKRKASASA